MRAESEMPLRHRWWHHLLTRKMGMWQDFGVDNETGKTCRLTRIVRYCALCRLEYHEGEPTRYAIDHALGAARPGVKMLPGGQPDNVTPIKPPNSPDT